MEFQKVIAISGMPGLYEMISQRPNGIIVKSLQNDKTQFVSNRIHTFSPLDKISIYTLEDSVPLGKVFRIMLDTAESNSITMPAAKANSTSLKTYLKACLPNYDEDRVYVSDIKKLIKWYHILKASDAIPSKEELASTEEEVTTSSEKSEVAE